MEPEELRSKLVRLRREEGLTIDQLKQRFPDLSRTKIGRMVKGVEREEEPLETNDLGEEIDSEGDSDLETIEEDEIDNNEEGEIKDEMEDETTLEKGKSPYRENSEKISLYPVSKSHLLESPHMNGEEELNSPLPSVPSSPSVPTSATVDMDKVTYYMSKKQKDAILELLRENAHLQNRLQATGQPASKFHDGHDSQFYDGMLEREMALSLRQRRFERMMGSEEDKKESSLSEALKLIQLLKSLTPNEKSPAELVGELLTVMESVKAINPTPQNWSPQEMVTYQKTLADIEEAKTKAKMDSKFKNDALQTVLAGLKALQDNPQVKRVASKVMGKVEGKIEGSNPGSALSSLEKQASEFLNTHLQCPSCLKNKTVSWIDVSDAPDVAVCKICGAEYPRNEEARKGNQSKKTDVQEVNENE